MSKIANRANQGEHSMSSSTISKSPAGYSGSMEQRIAAANASNALEGIEPSALMLEIQANLIAGKMTTDEALKKVFAAHKASIASTTVAAPKEPMTS